MSLKGINILQDQDITPLNRKFICDGKLQVLDASEWNQFEQEQISIFCVKNAFYGLPTTEMIAWLKDRIGKRSAIEIGAGNGVLGRALEITMTDSFIQDSPEVRAHYQSLKQPTIQYGSDVEKLDYKDAIVKYKPDVVIGQWVTQLWKDHSDDGSGSIHGLDEEWILENVPTYIHIGNENTHGRKRILKRPHEKLHFNWLFSRSMQADKCVIYVWGE